MARVALTGATGFIGGNLLSALTKSAFSIRALTRKPRSGTDPAHWVRGDLNNLSALNQLVDGCAAVIHCAGVVRGNSAEDFLKINLEGTENLLRAVREKTPAAKFLLISSLAARYPDYSWYARSKALAEEALMAEQHAGLSRTIYRPTAVYGPGDREMRPLLRLMRGGLLLTPKTPGTRLSLLHIDDLVNAVLAWLTAEQANGLFELDDGAPGGYRWRELRAIGRATWKRPILHLQIPIPLLKAFAHVNLLLARLLRYPAMLTPGKINEITHDDWVCDNTPLTACLGWQPGLALIDTIDAASA